MASSLHGNKTSLQSENAAGFLPVRRCPASTHGSSLPRSRAARARGTEPATASALGRTNLAMPGGCQLKPALKHPGIHPSLLPLSSSSAVRFAGLGARCAHRRCLRHRRHAGPPCALPGADLSSFPWKPPVKAPASPCEVNGSLGAAHGSFLQVSQLATRKLISSQFCTHRFLPVKVAF